MASERNLWRAEFVGELFGYRRAYLLSKAKLLNNFNEEKHQRNTKTPQPPRRDENE